MHLIYTCKDAIEHKQKKLDHFWIVIRWGRPAQPRVYRAALGLRNKLDMPLAQPTELSRIIDMYM